MKRRTDIARAAAAQDAEVERLVRIGVRAAASVGVRARASAIRAYRVGRDVNRAARDEVERALPIVASGMLAGYLQGRLRSLVTARLAVEGLALGDPFKIVKDYVAKRLDLSPEALVALATQFNDVAVSATQQITGRLEQFVSRALVESFARGDHVAGGVARLREAFTAAGVTPDAPHSLEAMFRTQHNLAYSAGRWQADQNPAVQEILWGYEYTTVRDNRVRPNHAALDGFRAPKEDPAWQIIWPPNGYNCRCTTIAIFYGDAEAVATGPLNPVEVGGVFVQPEPDAGFEFNPGLVFDALEASVF